MKNKNLIRFFAIVLTIVCLYEMSFTLMTYLTEKDAREYANGNIEKERKYLDSISNKGIYDIIIKDFTYDECKARELKLGLDLKGGMNVVLDISMIDLLKSMSNNSKDKTFLKSLEVAKEKQKNSSVDFITLFGEAYKEIEPEGKLSTLFSNASLKDKIQLSTSNQEVLNLLSEESDRAISRAYNILRTRIDGYGVSQPNIQRLENSGKILVELPGVTDVDRVRGLLQSTASLEFWETYEANEVFSFLETANSILAESVVDTDETVVDTDETKEKQIEKKEVKKENKAETKKIKDSIESPLDKISNNDSELNSDSSFKDFEKNNPLFAVLSPPLYTDENGQQKIGEGPVLGYVKKADKEKVLEYLNKPEIKDILPLDLKLAWSFKPIKSNKNIYQLIALKVTTNDGMAPLEGDVIVSAREDFAQNQASAEVVMKMNAEGSKTWRRLTKENIGKSVAVVLDNNVYSFPTVNAEISGGVSNITGNFTIEEARDLANILQAGKLPAPAKIIEETVVGPTLGSESIRAGLLSFLFALIIVLGYMIYYYGSAGLIANYALFANIFFIIGVLASFRATLTLPGIAGIVLTIGMSVDANVLIFERIREEIRKGKNIYSSITDGFANSLSAIIDANLTTLLVGIVLMTFGTGPIRGFSVTLVTGIFTSLFTAVVISRMIFQYKLDKKSKLTFASKSTKNFLSKVNINFLGKRKIAYIISLIVIGTGVVSLFTKGLNLGVDFKGGRSYVVRFEQTPEINKIRTSLTSNFDGKSPEIKVFGEDNQLKITTNYLIDNEEEDVDKKVEYSLSTGLNKITDKYKIMSTQKVGPSIADDIKESAFYSILVALAGIFIYILARFGRFQFSLGAIIALLHDVLLVLGLFSIFYGILPFSMEIDQSFIAALLTVVGYSVNDSVIIFDRVRETFNSNKKMKLEESINFSLNKTLSRTMNTSLTVIFVLVCFFIFGGEVIRGFSFAILVGVIVGTYSSLFIAAPVLYDTQSKINKIPKE